MTAPTIRERRKQLGLSQQELAQRAQCSLASVSMFDRGLEPEHSPVRERVIAVLAELETGPVAS